MPSATDLPETLRNTRACEVLERSLAHGRLPHGILLHGENLPGLESIARAITARLLDAERDPFEHPDCFILRPAGKARRIRIGSESERVGGEWPRNSMRRLVLDLHKSANQSGRKVGLVVEADRMNVQSANAFLKTLEEPPADTTIFLLTTRPYDLLPTIRSRCLNFRVPVAAETTGDADWEAWCADYREWLGRIAAGPGRKGAADLVFGAYGLVARFARILDAQTAAAWDAQKSNLPDHLPDEEKVALETGLARGIRQRLFGDIEKQTLAFAREREQAEPGSMPVNALQPAIEALEHCAGLLEINFQQNAALETFFLRSLRIWSRNR